MVVNKAPLALSFLLIFALPDISFAATMTLHAAVKAAKKGQNPLDPVAACRIWINGLYDSCENTTQDSCTKIMEYVTNPPTTICQTQWYPGTFCPRLRH